MPLLSSGGHSSGGGTADLLQSGDKPALGALLLSHLIGKQAQRGFTDLLSIVVRSELGSVPGLGKRATDALGSSSEQGTDVLSFLRCSVRVQEASLPPVNRGFYYEKSCFYSPKRPHKTRLEGSQSPVHLWVMVCGRPLLV